jgi:cytochrome P450
VADGARRSRDPDHRRARDGAPRQPGHAYAPHRNADTELGGQRIAKGDKVVMWYTAANRDPAVFADPDAFDITRGNIQHLGFGSGQHVCVGSRLAEMQLRVAFRLLAERVKGSSWSPPRAGSGPTSSTGSRTWM